MTAISLWNYYLMFKLHLKHRSSPPTKTHTCNTQTPAITNDAKPQGTDARSLTCKLPPPLFEEFSCNEKCDNPKTVTVKRERATSWRQATVLGTIIFVRLDMLVVLPDRWLRKEMANTTKFLSAEYGDVFRTVSSSTGEHIQQQTWQRYTKQPCYLET